MPATLRTARRAFPDPLTGDPVYLIPSTAERPDVPYLIRPCPDGMRECSGGPGCHALTRRRAARRS